jgi:hypothetical protein
VGQKPFVMKRIRCGAANGMESHPQTKAAKDGAPTVWWVGKKRDRRPPLKIGAACSDDSRQSSFVSPPRLAALETSGADSSGLTEAVTEISAALIFGSRNSRSLGVGRCVWPVAVCQPETMRRCHKGHQVIAVIARHRQNRKGKNLPRMNTDDTDRNRVIGKSGHRVIGKSKPYRGSTL